MLHELKDMLLTYCGSDRVAATGLFRPKAVTDLIEEYMAGYRDHGRALWGLLNYMIWHLKYVA